VGVVSEKVGRCTTISTFNVNTSARVIHLGYAQNIRRMDTSFLIQAITHGCENQPIFHNLDPDFDYLHGYTYSTCIIQKRIRKQLIIVLSLLRVRKSILATDLAPPPDHTFNTKSTCMHASQGTSPDNYTRVPYSGSDHHIQTDVSLDLQRPWAVIDIQKSSTTLSRERFQDCESWTVRPSNY
jgi:hypothetical protein